jgi:Tfp pilus assembly protein PilE
MKPKGFSLLSLLAVLAAVALLAAIIVPNFIRARAQSRGSACPSNLKNIGTAFEMYSTDYAGEYPKELDLIVPNYLKTIPECPAAGRVTYRNRSLTMTHYECPGSGQAHDQKCAEKLTTVNNEAEMQALFKVPAEEQRKCPSGAAYVPSVKFQTYEIFCRGKNHVDRPANYPRYNGVTGLTQR